MFCRKAIDAKVCRESSKYKRISSEDSQRQQAIEKRCQKAVVIPKYIFPVRTEICQRSGDTRQHIFEGAPEKQARRL